VTDRASEDDTQGRAVSPEWIWGAEAIAAEIGRTRRQTFHMLEQGSLPAVKVGGRWVADAGALRRRLAGKP